MTTDETASARYDYTIMIGQVDFPFGLKWATNANEPRKIKVMQIQSESTGRDYMPLRRMRMERCKP